MSAFAAMVWNGFREARRNRVTVVVGVFAVVVLLSSTLVTEVTVSTFERVLTDFGLGMMSLILVFLAIYLSSGLLSREIERRTIFLIVSKPLSRSRFLIARLLGNMLTLGVLLVAMTLIFFLELGIYSVPIKSIHLLAVAMLWFELLVVASAGFFFSAFSGQMVSAIATTGLYLAGHLSSDIYNLAARSESAGLRALGKGVYYVLPDLSRLNFRPMATYDLDVAASSVLGAMAYGTAYAAVLCTLSALIFSRRDFR
jgi:Cu-processing system permease protein